MRRFITGTSRALVLLILMISVTYGQAKDLKIFKQEKGWTAKFQVALPILMEKSMQALENKGIFITAFDMQKGTVITEYKPLDPKEIQSKVTFNLEASSFKHFRYQVKLLLIPEENGNAAVNALAVVKGYGRPLKYMGARPGWYTLPSNGALEKEVLEIINKNLR